MTELCTLAADDDSTATVVYDLLTLLLLTADTLEACVVTLPAEVTEEATDVTEEATDVTEEAA